MWVFSFTTILVVYLSVNAYGVIGSIDNLEGDCHVCQKSKCHPVSGIYTAPGAIDSYALIAEIPQFACKVLVQQLRPTRNFLALKHTDGAFILNGDGKQSNSRSFEVSGVRFTYLSQDNNTLETITAMGPLVHPIDIMIGHYQPDAAIKYHYIIPWEAPKIAPPLIKRPYDNPEPKRLDTPSLNSLSQRDEAKPSHTYHRRLRTRRRFSWKITGMSPCTKTCGGGTQIPLLTCIREHTQTAVIDRRCSHLEKPPAHSVQCNTIECPPIGRWTGYWSDCSVTCGEGVEEYIFECRQDIGSGRSVVVNENSCSKKPTAETRACNRAPCDSENEVPNDEEPDYKTGRKDWTIGIWSECSVTCGTGHRSRSITCPSGLCNPKNRPMHAEYCNMGECPELRREVPSRSHTSQGDQTNWLVTEWSQCSEICGTGTQTRLALCPENNCESNTKPELSRACSSEKQCNGEWFSGPWGPCSDACSGQAKQKREVFCIVKIRGHPHITNDMTCSSQNKPHLEQACEGRCPAQWFTGEWGSCEGSCPTGSQRRKVTCLEANGTPSQYCNEDDIPIGKRSCACQRREDHRDRYRPAQDEPADRSCVDKIRTCHLAVQARLCQYQYYTNHCCAACKRAQPDLLV